MRANITQIICEIITRHMTTTDSEAAEKVRGIGKLFAEKIRRINNYFTKNAIINTKVQWNLLNLPFRRQ